MGRGARTSSGLIAFDDGVNSTTKMYITKQKLTCGVAFYKKIILYFNKQNKFVGIVYFLYFLTKSDMSDLACS